MSAHVNPIPDGYRTIAASLNPKGAAEAIEFYKKAFGATERYRLVDPDGKIKHAELQIGDSVLLLSEEVPEWGAPSPKTVGGCPTLLRLSVPDVDALAAQAVAAGITVTYPVQTHPWGDRSGAFEDPFGYRWSIGTKVEDVSPEEIRRRMGELFGAAKE